MSKLESTGLCQARSVEGATWEAVGLHRGAEGGRRGRADTSQRLSAAQTLSTKPDFLIWSLAEHTHRQRCHYLTEGGSGSSVMFRLEKHRPVILHSRESKGYPRSHWLGVDLLIYELYWLHELVSQSGYVFHVGLGQSETQCHLSLAPFHSFSSTSQPLAPATPTPHLPLCSRPDCDNVHSCSTVLKGCSRHQTPEERNR